MKSIRTAVVLLALAFVATGAAYAEKSPAGTYKCVKRWTNNGRELAIRFTLILRDNGEARLVSDRQGDIPINPDSLERHGQILEFMLPNGRAVHSGRWRWGFNFLEVNLTRLSDGRAEVERESQMLGRWDGQDLVFYDFNRRLYGERFDFRFQRERSGGFGWQEALIAGGVLIALGAILSGGSDDKPKPTDEPVRVELQEQLDRFTEAWSRGDMEAVAEQIPEGFVFYDANGTEYKRPEFLDSVQRRVDVVQEASVTATLSELTVKPDEAIGIVKLKTTGKVADWWGAAHELEVLETARMFWEKPDAAWVLRSARSLQVEQKIDGKVVAGFSPWE
ncbi:MAG: nuclear transport factor 2 family protein [Armatimonadetes bacterium]|nr:nuclear transport factor 2 family protein [Armatimonadota bacterium]